MMLVLAVSVVSGIGLGSVFRVWILVPAVFLTMVLLALTPAYAGAFPAPLMWIASVLALQLGYGVGLVLRPKRMARALAEPTHPRSEAA